MKKGKNTKENQVDDELCAVISLALYLNMNEIHDYEKTILTIDKVARTYSPWSSKIYSLRIHPRYNHF